MKIFWFLKRIGAFTIRDETIQVYLETRSIRVRQARWEDLPGILEVEKKAWPENLRANRQVYESRLEIFPEGLLVAERKQDRLSIEGVVVIQKVASEVVGCDYSWNRITDRGRIRRTHNPEGDTFYVVNLSVNPFSVSRVALDLLEAVGKKAIRGNIKQIVIGARIPSLRRFVKRYSLQHGLSHLSQKEKDEIAKEYINALNRRGKPLDPQIAFYKRVGMQVIGLLPDYMEDFESLNYGVRMGWKNPFYGKPFSRFWSWAFKVGY